MLDLNLQVGMMPDVIGMIIGTLSIAGMLLLYRHSDVLSDGNVG